MMLSPDVLNWLSQQAETDSTIDDLVDDGWMGCSLEDLIPWLSDREIFIKLAAISWQKTAREPNGEVALMTADTVGLDELLEWMLDNRGQCPKVYAAEEEPEVPAAIPLLRPLAFNLPDGLSSEDVLDEDMMQCLSEIFANVKESFGNQAHLVKFDYVAFADSVSEHNAVYLSGEFIDLTDGELFDFTLDARKGKLQYKTTGRVDAAFRKQVDEQQEINMMGTGQELSLESRSDVQPWLDEIPETDRSLEQLLADGFQGFWLGELQPWLSDQSAFELLRVVDWVRTRPDESGMAALLTENIDRLEMAIDALDKGGEICPTVLAVDERGLSIDALPLQRPTAYNLQEGLSSRDVVTREFHDLLEQIFADLKQAYGERAHLYRFDYGTFMEFVENQDVIVLHGEFVDLEDREIYTFTMDGVQQRLRFASTNRYHSSRVEPIPAAGTETKGKRGRRRATSEE